MEFAEHTGCFVTDPLDRLTPDQFAILSYHAEINYQKRRLEDQLPHVSEEGHRKIIRTLAELDEMQSYLDPEKQEITHEVIEKRRLETRQKMHDVMSFLKGDK